MRNPIIWGDKLHTPFQNISYKIKLRWLIRLFEKRQYSIAFTYLHHKAEELNGYDICHCNPEALEMATHIGMFLCKLKIKKKTYQGIVILCHRRSDGLEGLVCLVDDIEGILNAFEYLKLKHKPSMYDHDEKSLIKSNKDTHEAIWKYFRELECPWMKEK